MPEPHPDYLAQPTLRRWGRPLTDLLPVLKHEAWEEQGKWAWRVLPHGALVSVRISGDAHGATAYSTELRIARKVPLADAKAAVAWAKEVQVFLKHFGGTWQVVSSAHDKCDVTFSAPFGRPNPPAAKEMAKCADCGAPCEPGPYKPNRCTGCAMKAGQAGGSA